MFRKVGHFLNEVLQSQHQRHTSVIHSDGSFEGLYEICPADLSSQSFTTGTSVMTVTATDADDPMTENAVLSYSIIGQDSIPPNAITKIMFGINNETGAIYTRDVGLDREVNRRRAFAEHHNAFISLTCCIASRRW